MKRVWCLDLPLLRTSHNTPKKSPSDTDNLFWRCGGLLASCRSICFRHDMRQPILKIRILPNNLITSLQTQRSFALYASYFTRHHMSTNSNSKNPSIFGNICHVTAIEQSDPNIAVEADGKVAQKRRLWLHQLVANLLRRCSIRRSVGIPSETAVRFQNAHMNERPSHLHRFFYTITQPNIRLQTTAPRYIRREPFRRAVTWRKDPRFLRLLQRL